MNRLAMIEFANDWVAAWNRKDLEAILSHFSEDATFISQRAKEILGTATIIGKSDLRRYWAIAMQRIGRFDFRLDRALWDPEALELTVVYTNTRDGNAVRACELMKFDSSGIQVAGEALYGASMK